MKMLAVVVSFAAVAVLASAVRGGAETANTPEPTTTPAASPTRTIHRVPLVRQAFRNNCETASLSMMLAAAGRALGQRQLQREVAKSGSLDPMISADGSWTWGDPDRGFVGRASGGGVAGGFGVYQGPIRRLAARHGVRLDDLSRRAAEVLYERLRAGRPVMAWIGLSEGPYRRWRTPAGKSISVNFGEHVVVLTAIRRHVVFVNDPLSGTQRAWSAAAFERMWSLLGRRALSL